MAQEQPPRQAETKKAPARQNYSFNPKYEYPDGLPAYVPPKERQPKAAKKAYLLEEPLSSGHSQTETESDPADDEFFGQFTSNHEFLCSTNQIKQSRCEGNA